MRYEDALRQLESMIQENNSIKNESIRFQE